MVLDEELYEPLRMVLDEELLYGRLRPWWPPKITESQCDDKSADNDCTREKNLFTDVHDSLPPPADITRLAVQCRPRAEM